MKLSRNAFIIVLIIINIALDQISKAIARVYIQKGEVIDVIGDVFQLYHVENKGAFLGMGSDMNDTMKLIFLLILPVLVLGYVIYFIVKNKELDKLSLIAFCCIVGGGIANVYDRIVYGKVTDFLHLDFGGVFRTGIFNVADMSVTTGMIILLYASFFIKPKKEEVSNN
ncbi:signal peptidase II [Paucihalobacter ruber]|uniref:Lipoprotein signal peptidase n=1 Tax=Paucihalobacter ruber TaxID=2567861 RepID=A0A506PPJ4_9FLAO|nr:signal peptidase II [Paucihalobacter ruber]TPV35793.1 signal peptidase II [Paucihalobacter ruber]